MRVITANVNGIRAAARRGGLHWLVAQQADVWCLQEVRAAQTDLDKALADAGVADWHVAYAPGAAAGRAGVAVVSRLPLSAPRVGLAEAFAEQGRWIEADVDVNGQPVTIASVYVHTGEAGTERQDEKYAFLDAMTARMGELGDRPALITGDLNVAHREEDLKNWKGNLKKAGFLPDERARFDHWFDTLGWHDVGRRLGGPGPGPYTWWSWRGQAFDNDSGWRIDYQLASVALGERARAARVGRADSYAQRWSDHAAVVVDYDL